jgi:hypothetical protein
MNVAQMLKTITKCKSTITFVCNQLIKRDDEVITGGKK